MYSKLDIKYDVYNILITTNDIYTMNKYYDQKNEY